MNRQADEEMDRQAGWDRGTDGVRQTDRITGRLTVRWTGGTDDRQTTVE